MPRVRKALRVVGKLIKFALDMIDDSPGDDREIDWEEGDRQRQAEAWQQRQDRR